MQYKIIPTKKEDFLVSKFIHSVFFEYFGHVIYDGIWVGRDSDIPNVDGIRRDVINGCRELGIGAMRWPGGCCADHYHWKNGIGKVRESRYHPIPDPANPVWRNDFGTDEFLRFCELCGAEPILTVNTATGSPEEFLDWYEYVNCDTTTKYGKMRAENGHSEPYNVKYWGIGNTDENVWHASFNDPLAYGRTYLQFRTVLREDARKKLYFIGLGLSMRHGLPGWAGKMLDYVTHNRRDLAPQALSVHHYLGEHKQDGAGCGGALDYTDDGYYKLLNLLERYQYDIDLHRVIIREHTPKDSGTKICFDEWGAWHPEATFDNNQNQPQTMRDAIFAATALHIFYRNCDIVEFAMETQLSNLLQSLFETDGEKFYKTPTFYAMKLLREHIGQYIVPVLPFDIDDGLDTVATMSDDGRNMTISIINRHLYDEKNIDITLPEEWKVSGASVLTSKNVRDRNSFDNPEQIRDRDFDVTSLSSITIPKHSIVRILLAK